MTISARSFFSRTRDSRTAGQEAAEHILDGLHGAPQVVLTYLTVSHEQAQVLEGLRAGLGPNVAIMGCSGQGVIGRGDVREEGYAASFMALGGEGVRAVTAHVEEIAKATREKGQHLGRQLLEALGATPKVVVLHYDPLTGADADDLLGGLYDVVQCPIVGGAAAHYFGTTMTTTYQYADTSVHSHAAVAMALTGDCDIEVVSSLGCSPVGVEMKVTRCEGNRVTELDGRPALEVWREISGARGVADVLSTSAVAIGVPTADGKELIRAAFMLDEESQGFVLQTSVETGTTITLHHRTVDDVLNGSKKMGEELIQRLNGRQLKATLCFECGARTQPFLGTEATRQENQALQQLVGPDAAWAGVCVWGEVFPSNDAPGFHNYTYPLVAIVA